MGTELVRYATLANSSHDMQCWRFALEKDAITILPNLSCRCPAVDPDDHPLFVALGCAAEDPIPAARAHGLRGEAVFDERFALQATALDIRTAHVDMPVDIRSLRPKFASALDLGRTRPDLVIRFGRGPTLPSSLRRPVQAVLV